MMTNNDEKWQTNKFNCYNGWRYTSGNNYKLIIFTNQLNNNKVSMLKDSMCNNYLLLQFKLKSDAIFDIQIGLIMKVQD